MSHGAPPKWTGRMPTVRSVIAASTAAGSICRVSGSISTNTDVPPSASTMLAVAAQVMVVMITSSPGFTPRAMSPMWRPPVAEETASTSGAPT